MAEVTQQNTMIIGIDIGLMGAIACIDEDGKFVGVWDTPIVKIPKMVGKKGKEVKKIVSAYNLSGISQIFNNLIAPYIQRPFKCFIEEALIIMGGGKKRFNVKTNISLARCQGIFEGVSTSYGMNPSTVDPRIWQKHFGISGKNGDTGDQSIAIAKSLFPDVEFETKRGRKLDGRSDALLLAYYGMITMKTGETPVDK
jgi:hypothetical protein